jgi:hypothetical protein
MTNDPREVEIISRLRKQYAGMTDIQLKEIYNKFVSVSTLLYKISNLESEIENLKEQIDKKYSRKESLIYLIFSVIIVISLFYFDKLEFTVFVLLMYFVNGISKEITKSKNEILLNLKNTQKYQLEQECINYGYEINELEYLVKEIRKNPWMINSYDYFFKEINCWIFHKVSEEHDIRDDIEHLLSVENRYKK